MLVAEDNRDLANAICALIAAEPDMAVDGIANHAADLLVAAARTRPHVLVLDLNLGGKSSLPSLLELQQSLPQLAVVIYSGHDPRDLGDMFTHSKRCEYVTKSGDPGELIGAIRHAATRAAGAKD